MEMLLIRTGVQALKTDLLRDTAAVRISSVTGDEQAFIAGLWQDAGAGLWQDAGEQVARWPACPRGIGLMQ